MSRDTRLTLWPEQTAFLPLSNSWADIKNTETLDLSQCCGVHSCGLAATVLNLQCLFNSSSLKKNNVTKQETKQLGLFVEQRDKIIHNTEQCKEIRSKNRQISTVVEHNDQELMKVCKTLGFFECIKTRLSDDMRSKYCAKSRIGPICTNYFSMRGLSYPIYHCKFENYKVRRDFHDDLFDYTEPIFDEIFQNQDRGNQLNHVLDEIFKNIADHTDADGFMGLDVIYSQNKINISILIGDLGPGIYKHISKFVAEKYPSRKDKLSFAEAYKWALTDEVSGSKKPENYGCGMSSIVNNCIAMDVRISVFDQLSRLVLSSLPPIDQSPPGHNPLWRSSFRFDGKKPFFYFIECEEPLQ